MGAPVTQFCPTPCQGWPYESLSVCPPPQIGIEYEGGKYCVRPQGFPRDPSQMNGSITASCPAPSVVWYRTCSRQVRYIFPPLTVEVGETQATKQTITVPAATITENSSYECVQSPGDPCGSYGFYQTDYALPRPAGYSISDVFLEAWDHPWRSVAISNYRVIWAYYQNYNNQISMTGGGDSASVTPTNTSHLGATWEKTYTARGSTIWTPAQNLDVQVRVVVTYSNPMLEGNPSGPNDWYNAATKVSSIRYGPAFDSPYCLTRPGTGVQGYQDAAPVRLRPANSLGNVNFIGPARTVFKGFETYTDRFRVRMVMRSVAGEFVGAAITYRPKFVKRAVCLGQGLSPTFGGWFRLPAQPWFTLTADHVTTDLNDLVVGEWINVPQPDEGEQIFCEGFEIQTA